MLVNSEVASLISFRDIKINQFTAAQVAAAGADNDDSIMRNASASVSHN